MIFATIGNEHKPFLRFNELVLKISDLFPDEKIIYQKGYTKFSHKKHNIFDKEFVSRNEFANYLNNSSYVFSHGGAGTLLQLAKIKKIPFVLPRLKTFKEHINSHQHETVEQFKELGLVIEIDYPIKEKSLKKKILIHQNSKIITSDLNSNSDNSLIKSIKRDVKTFLKKNN
ncbi:hypothetical protein OA981_02870 [Prochlorococcus sp. AH-716-A09]|nr:hypothetical protein [Prochlorococcus sp. AH-716-A09]